MLSAIVLALGPFGCPSEPEATKAQQDEPAEPARREATESGGPAAQAPQAQPQPQPKDPQPKDPQPKTPEQLSADVAQSKVRFLISRAVGGHIGQFERFSSTI